MCCFRIPTTIGSLFFFIFLLTMPATADECIQGNNIRGTEKRMIAAFHSVDISGAFTVKIQPSQSPGVTVTTDTNLLPHIITQVKNETLFVYADHSICTKISLAVQIESRNIKKVKSSGANDITYPNVDTERLEIMVEDAGEIQLSGKVSLFQVTLSDAADMEAENLRATEVQIRTSGAGDATVFASDKISADISGAGEITVHGNPKTVVKNISDEGELTLE